MKQQIKNIAFLMLMMICFTSSHEETCISIKKCTATSVAVQKNREHSKPAITESDRMMMPLSTLLKL